ncbi:hypothetical protein [Mucilaginibacter myungsuensis]|uniref:Uncharacterized protein n=1 Tax=Mucilaginibacter myungsuensis TaxID=649104 RepID=A0A929KU88_9SPHI|nr:hypothetical protein [Mucilaginibacter myungsuensis]MBE9661287.1 hypothetical protein [Mucilaginibacter myungsuensis]MDN3597430.1 hypothetical protein [Mucilaginibacter myungsuensis]
MKRKQQNILYAWLLLLFFAAGQYIVFSHTHYRIGKVITAPKSATATVKEKCDICDVMHHTHAEIVEHAYFTPVAAILCHYTFKQTDVKLIQLVLASGRAPPVVIS